MLKHDKRPVRYHRLCPQGIFEELHLFGQILALNFCWVCNKHYVLLANPLFSSCLAVLLLFYILCTNTFNIFVSNMNCKLCGIVVPL